jgi:hypothetical protein
VQPGSIRPNTEPVADSYPWYDDTAAEQLRQDQCLMADVLRLGGPSMAAAAQDGLNQTPDKLHVLADRKNWERTPLAVAYNNDRDAAGKEMDALSAQRDAWQKPLDGLATPGGFTDTDFHWPPDGDKSFYSQTGLSAWVADRFWKTDSDFYDDATPKADDKTLKAVDQVGDPLYGKDPDPTGTTSAEWNRALAERSAFQWMHGGPATNAGADDARLFLSSGGFPHTAPQPGTPEYRIAVEDVKSRFAACGWRDPVDPDGVLGDAAQPDPGREQGRGQRPFQGREGFERHAGPVLGRRPSHPVAGLLDAGRSGLGGRQPHRHRGTRREGQVPRRPGRQEGQRHAGPGVYVQRLRSAEVGAPGQ